MVSTAPPGVSATRRRGLARHGGQGSPVIGPRVPRSLRAKPTRPLVGCSPSRSCPSCLISLMRVTPVGRRLSVVSVQTSPAKVPPGSHQGRRLRGAHPASICNSHQSISIALGRAAAPPLIPTPRSIDWTMRDIPRPKSPWSSKDAARDHPAIWRRCVSRSARGGAPLISTRSARL